MKKVKSELSALERQIQLTLIPKQGLLANKEQKQAVTEIKQEKKCADSSQPVRIRI